MRLGDQRHRPGELFAHRRPFADAALQKANKLAKEFGVRVKGVNADLTDYAIDHEAYDLIVTIDFYRRGLISKIKQGVKKNGFVVYQALTVDPVNLASQSHSVRRDYLLNKDELRNSFRDWNILFYRETNEGNSAVAELVARKP